MRSLEQLLLVLSVFFCATFSASVASGAPAKRIYAGVYLHDVTKFDQKDGVFDVDMELWAKWLGDFDKDQLSIANAAEVERTLIGEETDGAWHSARWRVKGTLRGEFPVQRFPFDEQTLKVILELMERQGELVPDLAGSGMRERFSITGWLYEPSFVPRVAEETYRSDLGSIEGEGSATKVRRAAFEVTLRRPLLTAATKLFVPLLVILLVGLIALMVHPKWLDVRSGVGVTALLACFAFQFSVADTMPAVAYMTLADVLFLVAYALTAVMLCVSVIAAWLHDRNRERAWKRLDIGALALIPIALVVVVAVATRRPAVAAPVPVAALGGDRPASSRDIVRIGTNNLTTPMGGLSGRAANWGTVRTELDGTRIPVIVEEVPSIANDALRFLAGGELEVTWRLRDGQKWSDGQPLTASDLVFALEVSPDARVAETRVVDARTLVVRWKDRVAIALENITPLPRHALEAEFKKGGYDAVREYRRANVLPSAGPYRVTEFIANERVTLEANPHFSGPAPSIKRIEIKRFPDDAAIVRAFTEGQIDMIAPNAISPEAARELDRTMPDSVAVRPSEVQMFLHADPAHPLLSKLEVRRALLMAIDRERLRTEVFGPEGRVSNVPVPQEIAGAQVTPFDLETARKALEAAGAIGQKIPLFHGSSPVDADIAARIAKDLVAVGLVVEPKEEAKLGDLYRKRNHGGLLLSSTTGERDSSPEKYWSVPQADGKYVSSYRNDAYDDEIAALVAREERALYPERREQIRDMLFVAYSKRLPSLPLFFLADRIVASPSLKGWTEGSGAKFGTTIERWHFDGGAAPKP